MCVKWNSIVCRKGKIMPYLNLNTMMMICASYFNCHYILLCVFASVIVINCLRCLMVHSIFLLLFFSWNVGSIVCFIYAKLVVYFDNKRFLLVIHLRFGVWTRVFDLILNQNTYQKFDYFSLITLIRNDTMIPICSESQWNTESHRR